MGAATADRRSAQDAMLIVNSIPNLNDLNKKRSFKKNGV
jgi:hypothetical protein